MIVTYLRSSSYNSYDWCAHQYFLSYVLGLPDVPNVKATLGNIVHKALEAIAYINLAKKHNKDYIEAEGVGKLSLDLCTVENLTGIAYNHYKEIIRASNITLTAADLKQCIGWVHKALEYQDGAMNPLNQNVIEPEKRFDIIIPHKWAAYSYKLPNGETLDGQLGLKGTIDLITEPSPGLIEVIDYKTGKFWNWSKDKEKTAETLHTDPQLRMYYYAAQLLYPKAEQIILTIYYINAGGAFSIPFDKRDIPPIELMLCKRFEEIKKNIRPKLDKTWKCDRLCAFKGKGGIYKGGKTACEYIHSAILNKGMDKVILEETVKGHSVYHYGDGGGKQGEKKT